MRRLPILLLAALLAAPLLSPAATATPKPLRIALVDTGIDATHPEFAPGQVVAWKDFTPEASPTPKDGFGHGTGTASLVAGLNKGTCGGAPKLSFAPGAPLIIARVGDNNGSITGDIDAAIRWSVAQGADVISMSIGSTLPVPGSPDPAIRDARAAGVLVVVAAGNGLANLGTAPYPSWLSSFGDDPNVLSVGGGSRAGGTLLSLTGNADPDVTSWSDSVCIAQANKASYVTESGTSFATPLVAGMAGKAIEIARANGQPADRDHIYNLVLLSASNSIGSPYAREGMGFLLTGQWPTLQTHAADGTFPDYDAQGTWAAADHQYHDKVVMKLRGAV